MSKLILATLILAISMACTDSVPVSESSLPWRYLGEPIRTGTTLPDTCTAGELFRKVDITANSDQYFRCGCPLEWREINDVYVVTESVIVPVDEMEGGAR